MIGENMLGNNDMYFSEQTVNYKNRYVLLILSDCVKNNYVDLYRL